MTKPTTTTEQQPETLRSLVINIVMTGPATEDGDPQVTHQVLVNGRPVEVAIAFLAAGEVPLLLTNGIDGNILAQSTLAAQAGDLGNQLQRRVLSALLQTVGNQQAVLKGIEQKVGAAEGSTEPQNPS